MKRLKTILLFLVICISCFGQRINDLIISKPFIPINDYDHGVIEYSNLKELGIEDECIKFNIAIDKRGFYYCIVNIFNSSNLDKDYYGSRISHLYLKTNKGEIVDLKSKNMPELDIVTNNKVTKFIFSIPNIRGFVSKDYVKCRIWLGERNLLRDLETASTNLFDCGLKNAEEEVTLKYKEYKLKQKAKRQEEQLRAKIIKEISDPLYKF